MKTLQHIIGWILKTLGILVAIGLIFSYLSRYISPAATWFFAFFGLVFPILFLLNVFLFIFWLILKRKVFWLHLVVLLPAFFFLPAYVQLWNSGKNDSSQQALKILTYNVHMFGTKYENKTDIVSFIKKEAPDIVCLQEIALPAATTLEKTFPNYPYIHRSTWRSGTAILSRHPIQNKGTILFSNTSGNVCLYVDIEAMGQTVRVYNNHLQSTKLNLTVSLSRFKQEDRRNEEIVEVSTRLRDAFVKRANQVDTVAKHIAASPYPVLVCGDFNDMPMSYTYRKMKGNLSDTFTKAGSGIPSTFRTFIPAFRIDYIFNDKQFETTSFTIPSVKYSDHYPVIATFTKKK